ncbi:lysozyme inhibitor LprI family protein [Pandoraea anhela]|nr:hypothetical protein [Pandoraea anhela]
MEDSNFRQISRINRGSLMGALGSTFVVIGVLTVVVGVFGFVDTRKVDRRFRTGYKNNEPDTRNFPRAGRRILWGVGICIVGAALNNLIGAHSVPGPANSPQVTGAANRLEQLEAPPRSVGTAPQSAESVQEQSVKGVQSTNERVVTSSLTPHREPQHASWDGQQSGGAQTFVTIFDCARASSSDELQICNDPGLAAMDVELGQMYRTALASVADPGALKRSQLDWLSSRRTCGDNLNCLRQKYGERIGQFNGSLGAAPLPSLRFEATKP